MRIVFTGLLPPHPNQQTAHETIRFLLRSAFLAQTFFPPFSLARTTSAVVA